MNNKSDGAGMLSGTEYKQRKSATLINDSKAHLVELNEIRSYLQRQKAEHCSKINALANSIDDLRESTRLIVTIIAYAEGNKIKNTLELYLNQDIEKSLFEIFILENHPKNIAKDNTEEEVHAFMRENPHVTVHYLYKVWDDDEYATVGNARKFIFDTAVTKILKRSSTQETILVSNDADPVFYEPNYLRAILHRFESDENFDSLITDIKFPDYAMRKPVVNVAIEALAYLELELVKEDRGGSMPADPYIMLGGSSAMRSAIYAAIGGSNERATTNDDRELGWIISDARDWAPSAVILLRDTFMVTDPRRQLDAAAKSSPVDQTLLEFYENADLRRMSNEDLLTYVSDDFNWEYIEDGLDSLYHSQNTGNQLYKRKFGKVFDAMMKQLGIEYVIIDGEVQMLNADKCIATLEEKYKNKVTVTHSQKMVYTPEMIYEIKTFFNSLSQGAVDAREMGNTNMQPG